jgi:glycosyltransferase involved in cell wall biosynthesis
VLHLINDVSSEGSGIVNVTVDLACQQARQGAQVTVASTGGGWVELLEEHGVEHLTVASLRDTRRFVQTVRRVRAAVRERDVQIVHAQMNYLALVGSLAVLGTRSRLVSTAHTAFKRDSTLMALSGRVIAVGASNAATMRRRGVPARRLRVVTNGTIGSPRTECHGPAPDLAHPAVVCVAGMYVRKGIDVLIRAFDRTATTVPGARLYLVGDGDDRVAFETLAQTCEAPDRIVFAGFQDQPRRWLEAAEVFALASRHDPFPLAVLEARDAGCAVVGSMADGIPEACEHGAAGWLVPVEDEAALAEALTELLTRPDVLEKWRAAAAHGLEKYTVDRVATDVERVYAELVP